MIPGTEHIHASMQRAKELLDFINDEPAMKWLIQKIHKEWNHGTAAYPGGDFISEAHITLAMRKFISPSDIGKSPYGDRFIRLATLAHGSSYPRGFPYPWKEEWVIFVDGEGYPSIQSIGETLDMRKIISALRLSGHDIAEAVVMYGR